MWYWYGMGSWWWLVMVASTAAVVFSIVWAVRSEAKRSQLGQNIPFLVLGERLCRGEIDREDYEERRRVVESHR